MTKKAEAKRRQESVKDETSAKKAKKAVKQEEPPAEIIDEGCCEDESCDGCCEMLQDASPVEMAVGNALSVFEELQTVEELEDALGQVKEGLSNMLYTATLNRTFERVLSHHGDKLPFETKEKKSLKELFSRCAVVSHTKSKDTDWTLGPRHEYCSVCNTIAIESAAGTILVTLECYWHEDDTEGFVEEISLTYSMEEDEEDVEGGDKKMDDDEDGEEEGTQIVTLLDARFSLRGESSFEVENENYDEFFKMLNCKVSRQSLLRFLILGLRVETTKLKGHMGSIATGSEEHEDTEMMCNYLLRFNLD